MVLEAGELIDAKLRIDVRQHLAHAPPVTAAAADVDDAEALDRLPLRAAEYRPDQLVTGADGEDHSAVRGRRGEPAAGPQPLRGQYLGQVLAAAEQVDVTLARYGLIGVHLDRVDGNAAQPRPARQDDQIAPVAVGAEQVRVDPDEAQGARPLSSPLAFGRLITLVLMAAGLAGFLGHPQHLVGRVVAVRDVRRATGLRHRHAPRSLPLPPCERHVSRVTLSVPGSP